MWPLRCPHHIITTLLQRLLKDNVAKQITLFLIFFHVDHHCLSKELAVNVILRQGSLFLIRHLAMSLHYKLFFAVDILNLISSLGLSLFVSQKQRSKE